MSVMELVRTVLPVRAPKSPVHEQILLDAAALIEEHGWQSETFGAPQDGGFCPCGAVAWVLAGGDEARQVNIIDDEVFSGAHTGESHYDHMFNGASWHDVSDWNFTANKKKAVKMLRGLAAGKTWREVS